MKYTIVFVLFAISLSHKEEPSKSNAVKSFVDITDKELNTFLLQTPMTEQEVKECLDKKKVLLNLRKKTLSVLKLGKEKGNYTEIIKNEDTDDIDEQKIEKDKMDNALKPLEEFQIKANTTSNEEVIDIETEELTNFTKKQENKQSILTAFGLRLLTFLTLLVVSVYYIQNYYIKSDFSQLGHSNYLLLDNNY